MRRLLLLGVLAAGCGGGTATPVPDFPPYFRVAKENFLGTDVNVPQNCDGTEVESCQSAGFFALLTDEIDGGYRGTSSVAVSAGAGTCSLGFFTYSATLEGEVLTYRADHHGESVQSEECDADEATARGTDMPCLSQEVIFATRVE
jgi:hypothetical protein